MKRLYFLVPDTESASSIVSDLKAENLTDEQVHVVGKDHNLIKQANLHEANVLQTTNIVYSLEKGALAGGVIGILLGVATVKFAPDELKLGGGAIMALAILGIGIGAWISSMIGVATPAPSIKKYQADIEAGQILILVDIPKSREQEITDKIYENHSVGKIENANLKQN